MRADFTVTAYVVNDGLQDTLNTELVAAGLPICNMIFTLTNPTGNFDVAIFAETTTRRLENFKHFLSHAKAARILLENP